MIADLYKLTHIRGDTLILPRCAVASENYSQASILGSVVRLQIRDYQNALVINALPEHIAVEVINAEINAIAMWQLRFQATIPASLMQIPIGKYLLDYEVTFPSSIVKTYYRAVLTIVPDATYA